MSNAGIQFDMEPVADLDVHCCHPLVLSFVKQLRQDMAPKDATIGFRISLELKAKLEELAEKDNRTLSNYIAHALTEHVKRCTANSSK